MNKYQIREKYPQLEQLFGAYFNSEWNEEHETVEDVLIHFVNNSRIDKLLDVISEIEELKKQFPENIKLKDVILEDLGLGFGLSLNYLKMTGVEWLDFITSIIKEELNKKQKKT